MAAGGRYNGTVSGLDLLVLGWIALSAVSGARRGLVADVLSLAGFLTGAFVGSRIAPHLLAGGDRSSWLPLAGLAGALVGGVAAQLASGTIAGLVRARILRGPLAALDTAGGLAAGALLGVAIAWLIAAVAIEQPSFGLRRDVQGSTILPELLRALPADAVL